MDKEISFVIPGLSRLKPIVSENPAESSHRPRFSIWVHKKTGRPELRATDIPAKTDRLPTADRRIINEMRRIADTREYDFDWVSSDVLSVEIWDNPHIVRMLEGNDRFFSSNGQPVEWTDAKANLSLELVKKGESAYEAVFHVMEGPEEIADPIFLGDDILISGDKIYSCASVGENFPLLGQLLTTVDASQLDTYISLFLSYFSNITVWLNGRKALLTNMSEKAAPTLVLEKVAPDQALYLRLTTTLESSEGLINMPVPLTRLASVTEDGNVIVRNVVHPDLTEDAKWLETLVLKSAPSRQARKEVFCEDNFFIVPAETASPFLINHLHEVLGRFRLLGSEKLKEYKVTPVTPKLNLRLSSGIDFLEGDAEVEIGNERMTLADLLDQFTRNRYVQLSDGNRAILNDKYMSRLQRLFDTRDADGRVRVSFFDLPEVESLINEHVSGDFAGHAREVFAGFNKLKGKLPTDIHVNATLRNYQNDGVTWLEYLYDNNLGGCLADDMGLGKTLQTIALLSRIYPAATKPTLIVMPRSLLFNWEAEFKRFAPQLSYSTYYGPGRDLAKSLECQVVMTTYAIVRNDIETLKDIEFECVVLDESQNIKNIASQASMAVTLLKTDHRLAISGTPMENNLTEIYSLFRFLNPAMFGTPENFNSRYTYPIQKNADTEAMQSLRRKIYPFMLRRLKQEVLAELPDRIDQEIFVEMSEPQQKLYENRRIAYKQEIESTIQTQGVAKAQFVMFQALSELRRIASVPETASDGRIHSPKIDALIESLSGAVENGHKVVVFFNFIAGIELTAEKLEQIGISYDTMTGSTSTTARKKIVNRFQTDPECQVLLMTLKVGGVGLNLTAADTVYICEPWWNKAAEEQAVNRLHRIGQKATVNSFSLITIGTIEEKILQLQQQKTDLFNQLIGSDSASSKALSEEDIDFILS